MRAGADLRAPDRVVATAAALLVLTANGSDTEFALMRVNP